MWVKLLVEPVWMAPRKNRFGKSWVMSPCDVFGPACRLFDNATPSRPVMSNPLRSTMVVPMWNPVAKTIQSRSYSALAVTIPRSEIVVMALWALTSTRDTLGRLKAGR